MCAERYDVVGRDVSTAACSTTHGVPVGALASQRTSNDAACCACPTARDAHGKPTRSRAAPGGGSRAHDRSARRRREPCALTTVEVANARPRSGEIVERRRVSVSPDVTGTPDRTMRVMAVDWRVR